MKLRYNLMDRRLLRYVRWCIANGEKPWLGCHILPETYMPGIRLHHTL